MLFDPLIRYSRVKLDRIRGKVGSDSRKINANFGQIDLNSAQVRLSAMSCIIGSDLMIFSPLPVIFRRRSIFLSQVDGVPTIRTSREPQEFLDDSLVIPNSKGFAS